MTDSNVLKSVIYAMLGMQRASWEQGVAAQALLELDRSGYTDVDCRNLVIAMAHDAMVRQDEDGRLAIVHASDPGCLDPASMVEPLLAASQYTSNKEFAVAAQKQIDFLIKGKAPRTSGGILSHRMDKVQFWVDGIYMGPPALASAGYAQPNESLFEEAVKQIREYRLALWDAEDQLFSHIWDVPMASFERKDYWGVGNGWALAGMCRVLFLLPKSMSAEHKEIFGWIKDNLDGVLAHQRSDHLFHNILNDTTSFIDTNVSQQVAYTIFLLVKHGLLDDSYLLVAEQIRKAVYVKVDSNGLVRDVCGSPHFTHSGTAAEGQAFFILMEAARMMLNGSRKTEVCISQR